MKSIDSLSVSGTEAAHFRVSKEKSVFPVSIIRKLGDDRWLVELEGKRLVARSKLDLPEGAIFSVRPKKETDGELSLNLVRRGKTDVRQLLESIGLRDSPGNRRQLSLLLRAGIALRRTEFQYLSGFVETGLSEAELRVLLLLQSRGLRFPKADPSLLRKLLRPEPDKQQSSESDAAGDRQFDETDFPQLLATQMTAVSGLQTNPYPLLNQKCGGGRPWLVFPFGFRVEEEDMTGTAWFEFAPDRTSVESLTLFVFFKNFEGMFELREAESDEARLGVWTSSGSGAAVEPEAWKDLGSFLGKLGIKLDDNRRRVEEGLKSRNLEDDAYSAFDTKA